MWISDSNQAGELENLTWNDGLCVHSGNSSGCSLVLKQSFNFNRYFNVLWLTKFVEHGQPPNMTEKHSRLVWFRGRWPPHVLFCLDDIGCCYFATNLLRWRLTSPDVQEPLVECFQHSVLWQLKRGRVEPGWTNHHGIPTSHCRAMVVFKVHHFSWNSWSQLEGFSWHLGLGLVFFVSVRKIGKKNIIRALCSRETVF